MNDTDYPELPDDAEFDGPEFDGPDFDGPEPKRGGGPRGRGRRGGPEEFRDLGRGRGGHHGRRGFGPGGPGFDPRAFGPGFEHPMAHGFGPRRARRGDVRQAILTLLSEEPLNGYQIIKRIARNTGGMWRPSSGSVYPTLQQLVTEGLVEAADDGPRTVYKLTEAGRGYIAEHAEELAKAWEVIDDSSEESQALRASLGRLVGAAQQLMMAGTDEQATAATEVLDEARRSLYRILAD